MRLLLAAAAVVALVFPAQALAHATLVNTSPTLIAVWPT